MTFAGVAAAAALTIVVAANAALAQAPTSGTPSPGVGTTGQGTSGLQQSPLGGTSLGATSANPTVAPGSTAAPAMAAPRAQARQQRRAARVDQRAETRRRPVNERDRAYQGGGMVVEGPVTAASLRGAPGSAVGTTGEGTSGLQQAPIGGSATRSGGAGGGAPMGSGSTTSGNQPGTGGTSSR